MKYRRNLNLERWILRLTPEEILNFDYCEKYLRSTSNKILLRQCQEKQMLIHLPLYIDKKSRANVNKKKIKKN